MNPTQLKFIQQCYPLASMAGGAFDLNPTVIMAQSAIETGWGTSELCTRYCNYFGISAYGKKNVWWQGDYVELDVNSIKFRRYPDASSSFMDYARLIRSAYPAAARVSNDPAAFAQSISYSHYISEVNGDNREQYRSTLVSISRQIDKLIKKHKRSTSC